MVKSTFMMKKRKLTNNMTKSKSTEKLPQSGEEVNSARDRFRGALQELLPRSDEDSDSSDEGNWSSKKRVASQKKKQPVQEPPPGEKPETEQSKAFVMKLYDRSVDLAQFSEKTPLYPICRAWIANTPHRIYGKNEKPELKRKKDEAFSKKKDEASMEKEDEEKECWTEPTEGGEMKEVFKLPRPEVCGNNKLRLPVHFPYNTKYLNLYEEGTESPSKEDLLRDNISHWINVRRTWMEASFKNDVRYEKSIKILSSIFNRNQQLLI